MKVRVVLSTAVALLLMGSLAGAQTAAPAGPAGAPAPAAATAAPPSLTVPAMSPATPPAPACAAVNPILPQLSQATPLAVTCGSCSGSCTGIPVRSSCILSFNKVGTCTLNGSCNSAPGGGNGPWCQCMAP
jgi:hypothetical protein